MKKSYLVLHPFLFTLFPVMALYANNLGEVPFAAVIRAIAVGLACAGGLLAAARLLVKDWHRAGAITTLAAGLFYTYGHIYRWLGKAAGLPPLPLAVLWVGLFAAGAYLIARRMPARAVEVTRLANLVGWIALATCLYGFGSYGVQALRFGEVHPVNASAAGLAAADAAAAPLDPVDPAPVPQPAVTETSLARSEPLQPPDIYYIILDAHGRSDVLDEIYGVDNSAFINYLRKRGFYVAGQSRSNYGQTALSLASSLNYNYLDAKITPLSETKDRGVLNALINDSETVAALRAQGYRTVAFNNGFPVTEMVEADTFVQDPDGLNNFEMTLITGALAQAEFTPQLLDGYRNHILWVADELDKAVVNQDDPRPKFVFAHFILPHPPFVFNADGSPRFSLDGGDGSGYTGTRDEYWTGYRERVQYADQLAEQLIDSILAHSAQPPIIILQGDHGSGLSLDYNDPQNTCLRERFSILNAYYLPKTARAQLYPTITPVNSFRVVLNSLFKADLPLLEDRSYFSTWNTPYQFSDITNQMERTCPSRRAGE